MKYSIILITILSFLSTTIIAQRGYIRGAIRRDIEKKQYEKHEDERKQGETAVDESLDKMDKADAEVRSKVEPFQPLSYTMQMEFPNKPKDNMNIDYTFKNYECAYHMIPQENKRGEDIRCITNFKQGEMLMLTTDKKGKKTGIIMGMKFINSIAASNANNSKYKDEINDVQFTKTNEFKTIEGYKCQKYIMEDERYTAHFWITTDKSIQNKTTVYNALSKAYSSNRLYKGNAYYNSTNGLCIQTHTFPKDKHSEESIMTLKNITTTINSSLLNTEGYEITKMPTMRDMWNDTKNER